MKVKNFAHLKVLVERGGMDVDEDGKVSVKAPTAPVPALPPDNDALLSAVRGLTDSVSRAVESNTRAVMEIRPPPASHPVRKWIFTVERDADGFVSRIVAEAEEWH